MVAEHEGKIAGHILFSRIEAPLRALTLAPPECVLTCKSAGIGSALIRHGLERAGKEGWMPFLCSAVPPIIEDLVLIRPWHGITTILTTGPAFMALLLHDAAPRTGRLVFPSAFDEDIREHAVRLSKGLM